MVRADAFSGAAASAAAPLEVSPAPKPAQLASHSAPASAGQPDAHAVPQGGVAQSSNWVHRMLVATRGVADGRTDGDAGFVRHIEQVDMEGCAVKRGKVGAKISVYLVLNGTLLTIRKGGKTGPRKHEFSVRTVKVAVHEPTRELIVPLSKERPLRLVVPSDKECQDWKHALDTAVVCDIGKFYKFDNTIGSGAYGEVVLAFDRQDNTRRAVKIIQRGSNLKSREHLKSEIEVMKSISHPNIVQTFEIYDLRRTIYIVMEFVPQGDLFDFVAKHSSLTEKQASQTMRSIFSAVEFLHLNSIVHRDLKPENILCANQEWPLKIKLTDFGFASIVDPSRSGDSTMRSQVGTPFFMAPEIIKNERYGPAVDSWACGVILYTILTGRLPFPGRNTNEYFENVRKGEPLFPTVLWKGISDNAKRLVRGLLNKDPDKRLTAMGALAHNWVSEPTAYSASNAICRDRSILHHDKRHLMLQKTRGAVLAIISAKRMLALPLERMNIPEVVHSIEDGARKAADGIGEGTRKVTSGVKKGVDGLGEGTKKVAGGVKEGVKKTADGIEKGAKKTAGGVRDGVKKTADGIEKGTKKTVDGVREGVKKTADGIEKGTKKTVVGVRDGVKKTADGLERGTKKTVDGVKEGVKKTADGIEKGAKKTADGIEKGAKKTADGMKKGAERVKIDRDLISRINARNRFNGGGSESTQTSSQRRRPVRSKSRSSGASIPEAPSRQEEPGRPPGSPRVSTSNGEEGPGATDAVGKLSSGEYFSADEEKFIEEDGWQVDGEPLAGSAESAAPKLAAPEFPADRPEWALGSAEGALQPDAGDTGVARIPTAGGFAAVVNAISANKQAVAPAPSPLSLSPDALRRKNAMLLNSNSSTGSTRPKLAPLSGLTMGLSDEAMTGCGNRREA